MITEEQNRVDHHPQELKISPMALIIDRHSIDDKDGSIPTASTTLSSPNIVTGIKDKTNEKAIEPYCILSRKKLIILLIITASGGMLSPLSANIYFPALNNIQEDLHTSGQQVNLTVTVYLIFQGLSPAFWSPLADLYGRRPIYLMTLFIYCLACIGLALSNAYGLLLFFRMVQAFGSSSLIAVGAGVIGDVAEPSKRAGFYGLFSMGQLLGPVIGPIVGGLVAGTIGWRWIFWILVIMAASVLTLVFFFVPETLRSLVGNGSGYANPTPSQWIKHRKKAQQSDHSTTKSRFSQCPDFLAPFSYLLQVDVLVCLVFVGLFYSCYYCYLVSATSLFSQHYGLTTIQIGLCFIPSGVGCVLGSFVAGKVMDKSFRRTLARYQHDHPGVTIERARIPLDFPIYHARLRTTWPFFILGQCVTLAYGWTVQYNVSLAVPIVFQFIVGFCMVFLMNGTQTLLVDLFPGRGASITASNNLVRCILGAITTVCVDPGIDGVGVGWFFTIVGLIIILSNGLYLYLLHIGVKYRKRRYDKDQKSSEENK